MTWYKGETAAFTLLVLLAAIMSLILLSPALASDTEHDRYHAKLGTPQLPAGKEGRILAAPPKPSAGQFLVATRQLRGSFFSGTVILLTKHDMHGSIGLVINKASEYKLSRALPGIAEFQNTEYRLYAGGPVEVKGITALIRSDVPPAKALHILENIYAVSDLETMKDLVASNAVKNNMRFYHGYAAWASGQLEHEILRGSWKLAAGKTDIVFKEDLSGVWRELLK